MKPRHDRSSGAARLALFSMALMPGLVLGQSESRASRLITKEEIFLGKPLEIEGLLGVTPDGRRMAYFAKGPYVFVDGVKSAQYDGIYTYAFTFSPDGRHFAYVAYRDRKALIVEDGAESLRTYDDVGFLVFSPDSLHLAFAAARGGAHFVVVDDKEGAPYEEIVDRPVFSPDGRSVAYGALRRGRQVVVVDGKGSGGLGVVVGFAWEGPNTIGAVVRRDPEYLRTVLELLEE